MYAGIDSVKASFVLRVDDHAVLIEVEIHSVCTSGRDSPDLVDEL